MPPNKGGNSKKEAGRARKADNEAKKQEVVSKQKEAKEAENWKAGAKSSSKADAEGAKKAEAAAKKAERAALLAAEEASAPAKVKAAPKAGAKKGGASALKPTAGAGIASFRTDDPQGVRRDEDRTVTELSAVGIDQMLEALELANDKTDASTMGTKTVNPHHPTRIPEANVQAAGIERHPERRFKAAFEAYLDREMPKLKEDHPGLRQNQMRDIIFKQFQKAPENPFNQVSLAYNASKEERLDALKQNREAREAKYRVEN
ncbi:uncharacterized protein EHS24_008560 [Apiotrichum porosum]|uniref:DUF1014 domain protein n=1 Tax=Apiotrichum porosum TaxID=105984 RepID=A0A427XQI7_9TREE|nr:uncharacterized protein EHS24_008560 [Apiotrichum porosum]RSH81126.1 hypothetical protein EHS24_008560 [Apiotrichum porosum]